MDSIEREIYARQRDVWERARRNPSYLAVCDKIEFNEIGYTISIDPDKKILKGEHLLMRFPSKAGLIVVIDPVKEFEEILQDMPIDMDGFSFSLLFDDAWEHVNPVYPKLGTTINDSNSPLREGKYLTLEIDITKHDKDIKGAVFGYIKAYRALCGIQTDKGGETFKKRFKYYDVWDQRKKRITFKNIALANKKSTDELFEKALDRVKKQFYKGFELIMGYPYDQEKFKQLQSQIRKLEIMLPCKDCPDKECRKAIERGNGDPCPAYFKAIEPYINQDFVKLREIPIGDPLYVGRGEDNHF